MCRMFEKLMSAAVVVVEGGRPGLEAGTRVRSGSGNQSVQDRERACSGCTKEYKQLEQRERERENDSCL